MLPPLYLSSVRHCAISEQQILFRTRMLLLNHVRPLPGVFGIGAKGL